MIKAIQIHKSFGSLMVLKGVDLEIAPGEIVSIMGRSGAGKSTLLQIIGTLDTADQGKVMIDNTEVSALSGDKLSAFRNEKLGFVFQFHHLLPEFTALENVMFPLLIKKESTSTARSKSLELLQYLGLEERKDHKPGQLSGGEQQRVAIARALINRPKVVLADEPTGNLDTNASMDFHQLISRLRNDFNQTFLIVTHNPDLAALSDRTLQMEDGRIL